MGQRGIAPLQLNRVASGSPGIRRNFRRYAPRRPTGVHAIVDHILWQAWGGKLRVAGKMRVSVDAAWEVEFDANAQGYAVFRCRRSGAGQTIEYSLGPAWNDGFRGQEKNQPLINLRRFDGAAGDCLIVPVNLHTVAHCHSLPRV